MHIKVKTRSIYYELDFFGKFNIITGKSGTRKTAFLKAINKYKSGIKSIQVKILSESKLISKENIILLMNDTTVAGDYHLLFKSVKNGLFIIDENSPLLLMPDISKVIKESENYFLFITRKLIGWLPISIDAIYRFDAIKDTVRNIPVYTKNNLDLISINRVDFILTEDSVGGRLFFEHYFSNIKVCPKEFILDGRVLSRNNTTLHEALQETLKEEDNVLVVFDASAYGFFFNLLFEVIKESKKSVSILSWNSFENYLLSTPLFSCILTKEDVGCKYNSLEQLSTIRLKELKPGYSKSKLPAWAKDNETLIQFPLTKIESGYTVS